LVESDVKQLFCCCLSSE